VQDNSVILPGTKEIITISYHVCQDRVQTCGRACHGISEVLPESHLRHVNGHGCDSVGGYDAGTLQSEAWAFEKSDRKRGRHRGPGVGRKR
jgi:hypothetical protein